MSLDTDFYIRSAASPNIGRERMTDLITAAVKQRVVSGEWTIHLGPFSRDTLKVPGSLVHRERKPLANGSNPTEALTHLASLPWGSKDIAIIFSGLDEENPAIAKDMSRYGYYNVDVVFLSLAAAKTITVTAVMNEGDSDDGEDDEESDEDEDNDEGDDEDSDDDDSDDDEGDRAPLELHDAWILTGQGGPLWDDLDRSSFLIKFAKKHFGALLFGETII